MIRKAHSAEWGDLQLATAEGKNVNSGEDAVHVGVLQQHFEEMRGELVDFGNVFDVWLSARRKALVEDKEAYLKTLAEEQDLVEALKRQLASLVSKRQEIVVALQAEQREFEEGRRSNTELEVQRAHLAQKLAEIRQETALLREQISQEETDLDAKEQAAKLQAQREKLEIMLSEEKLGLTVEPVKENVTKFVFKHIDRRDIERKFTVVVDVSTNRYLIQSCEPMISDISSLVDRLNQDCDFFGFLRKVRSRFIDLANAK